MRYIADSVCSAFEPKLLGCYEIELHDSIEELLRYEFDRVIDIGAAEGYYAVGWALRAPKIEVVAFEGSEAGRALLRSMCELNEVAHRVAIRGFCDVRALADALHHSKRPLVIIDAEGAEKELLDPEKIEALARATILVEVHDFVHQGIGAELKRRLGTTHVTQEISSRDRTINDSPVRSLFLDRWILKQLREFRPEPMQWLVLKPRLIAGR
jgi:hypothetical protein